MDDDVFYLPIIDVPLVGAAPSVKRGCIVEKHTNDIEAIDISENNAARVKNTSLPKSRFNRGLSTFGFSSLLLS